MAKTKPKPRSEDAVAEDAEQQDDVVAVDSPATADDLVEFQYDGITFVIPKDRDDWSTEAVAWLSEGKYNLFVKYLMEQVQPGQWKKVCTLCPSVRDWRTFFLVVSRAIETHCTGD